MTWFEPDSAEAVAEFVLASAVQTSHSREDRGTAKLSLRKLARVDRYEPGDLTIRVQAGMTVAKLLRVLGEQRQFLPLDGLHPDLTVGAALANAAHGALAAGYGLIRDYCIGIEYVTAEGKIAHAGGMVVKNVAGYDMMKLLIGSRGTLGIITAATFKCFPMPVSTTTLVTHFENGMRAVEYALKIRRSWLQPARLEMRREANEWQVLVTAAGSENVIARYRRELSEAEVVAGEEDSEFWGYKEHQGSLAEIWFPLGRAAEVLEQLEGASGIWGRIGLGNLMCGLNQKTVELKLGDSVHVEWRTPRMPLWLDGTMMRVKKALDPENKLNPGAIA